MPPAQSGAVLLAAQVHAVSEGGLVELTIGCGANDCAGIHEEEYHYCQMRIHEVLKQLNQLERLAGSEQEETRC
jgi:hypothetical protein